MDRVRELVEEAARQAERGALQADELGATLRAIATFRRDVPELKKQIGTISDTLLGRGLDLQATGTTDALWAVAELCKESPMLQGVLPVLVVRLAKTAPQLTPEETLSNLWSIGTLRAQFKDLQINMAPLVAFLANKLSKESLDEIPTQVLSDGLWALAMTRTLPNPVMKGLAGKLLGRLSERPVSEFTAHNTYSMMYSIAMLQETCTHAEARALLPKLLEAWELTAENMTPKQISGCLWALGWLDPGAKDSRGALVSVRNEIAFALAEMRMKELSEGLWGFAALEFGDQELLYMGAERFLEIHSRVRAPILAKHIARIMWAFAKFEFRHVRLRKALIERLAPEKHVIRFLTPDQLHAMLWSINRLIVGYQGRAAKQNLEAKVKAFIRMRYKHGWARVVDRYGDERVHKITTGRIEPYIEIDEKVPVELRNAAMLVAATDAGEAGPDVPNVRRKISGRPRWSIATWVDSEKRFVTLAARERQKALEAARVQALQAAAEEDEGGVQARLPEPREAVDLQRDMKATRSPEAAGGR